LAKILKRKRRLNEIVQVASELALSDHGYTYMNMIEVLENQNYKRLIQYEGGNTTKPKEQQNPRKPKKEKVSEVLVGWPSNPTECSLAISLSFLSKISSSLDVAYLLQRVHHLAV